MNNALAMYQFLIVDPTKERVYGTNDSAAAEAMNKAIEGSFVIDAFLGTVNNKPVLPIPTPPGGI